MPIPANPTFNDYRKILLKSLHVIILLTITGAGAALFLKLQAVSLYTAVAKISIVPPLGGPARDGSSNTNFSEFLLAQYEELRGRGFAEKVADELGWAKEKTAAVDRIMNSLNISAVSEPGKPAVLSGLVAIKASDRNPRVAMDIANTLAESFAQLKQQERENSGKKIYSDLVERVKKAKASLDESEASLSEFRKKEGLVKDSSKELNVETIDNMRKEVMRARKEKAEKQEVLDSLEKLIKEDIVQAITFVSEKIGNVFTVNVGLKQKMLEKENELNALKQVYKDKHPEIIRVKSEIALLRSQITDELSAAINSLKSDIATRERSEEVLNSYLSRPDLGERQSELDRLEKEVKLNRDIYAQVLRKVKETDMSDYIGAVPEVKIIEKASLPAQSEAAASFPWFIFPWAGCILGVVYAIMREYTDVTVKTIEDVERFFNISVLGEISRVKIRPQKAGKEKKA